MRMMTRRMGEEEGDDDDDESTIKALANPSLLQPLGGLLEELKGRPTRTYIIRVFLRTLGAVLGSSPGPSWGSLGTLSTWGGRYLWKREEEEGGNGGGGGRDAEREEDDEEVGGEG